MGKNRINVQTVAMAANIKAKPLLAHGELENLDGRASEYQLSAGEQSSSGTE